MGPHLGMTGSFVEVRLTGAAVTREAAPRKARAVAVNFILVVVDTFCSVVVRLPSQCKGMTKERIGRCSEPTIFYSICLDI